MINEEKFYENFEVPDCGQNIARKIVPKQLRILIGEFGKEEFSASLASSVLSVSGEEAEKLLEWGFREGILNRAMYKTEDGRFAAKEGFYTSSNLYRSVSIYAVIHNEDWFTVPEEERKIFLEWNLNEFCRLNHDNIAAGRRVDEVHTLQECLAFVDGLDENTEFTLQNCDCRSLYRRCNGDLETCIHMGKKDEPFPNSSVERGYGRVITREEVKEVIKRSNKHGLMQTYSPEGAHAICNCCGCCCFEFQGGRLMPDVEYPVRRNVAVYDETNCVQCGLCTKRCHFDAFEKVEGKIVFDASKCYGCGVCAEACPKKCISVEALKK